MLSGLGSLLSGTGVRPIRLPKSFLGYTPIFNLPYPTQGNSKPDGTIGISAGDKLSEMTIIENTMLGLSRVNYHQNYMIFAGFFADKSNHQTGTLIAELQNTLGLADNVVIGDDVDLALTYSWSGLSHTNLNYLWLSTVEDSDNSFNFKSSRFGRDLITEATTENNPPSGYKSVLVGTFMSGVGFDDFPYGSIHVMVSEHAENSNNPHGTNINQQFINCSGIEVLSSQWWDYTQASGAPVIFGRDSLVFWNDLTILPNSNVIASGLGMNTLSGSDVFKQTVSFNNFSANKAVVGYLDISSGLSTSGTLFRQNVSVVSGVRIDGVPFRDLTPLISSRVVSGSSVAHIHSISDEAEADQSLYPKYDGVVISPYPANTVFDSFSYDNSLENAPTMYRIGNSGWVYINGTWVYGTTPNINVFVRQWMPKGYTQLDRIEVHHRLAKASPYYWNLYPTLTAYIVDAAGNTLTPVLGNSLSIVSGNDSYMVISGIDQSNLAPDNPWDLQLVLSNMSSGTAIFLGEIRTYYKTLRS